MLLLLANQLPLILYPNTGFNLTVSGPVEGGNTGAYIYSTAVPYEGNAVKFGFPARLTRLVTQKASIAGEIKYGLHILSGQWNAKSSNGKTIELEMLIGGAHFNSLVEGHTLPEYFDIATAIADFPAHINAQVLLAYPAVNHQFPSIYNPGFYGTENANPNYNGVINDFQDGFLTDVNATAIVPQLYLLYIIKQMFAAVNYNAVGNLFNDTYFQKALVYNNYACDRLLASYFHGEIDTYFVYAPYNPIWNVNLIDPLEVYNETTGMFTIQTEGAYQVDVMLNAKMNTADPVLFFIVDLLYDGVVERTSIYNVSSSTTLHDYNPTFNLPIAIADLFHDIQIHAYFQDEFDVKWEPYVEHGSITILNTTTPKQNVFSLSYNYKNHVPNMDVKSFFLEVCNSAKIIPFFNESVRSVELVFMRDEFKQTNNAIMPGGLLRDSLKVYSNDYDGLKFSFDFQGPDELLKDNFLVPEDLTDTVAIYHDLPVTRAIGDIYLVSSLNAYYQFQMIAAVVEGDPVTFEWAVWGDNHQPVVYDNGIEPISTAMAPLLMRNYESNGYRRSLPAINAEGHSEAFALKGEFPLRIMFYAGLLYSRVIIDSTNGYQYPYASTTKYDLDGNVVLPIDYTWPGLISRYWLPVIAWYKRRLPIEFTNLVTPAFIVTLNLLNRFRFQNTLIFLDEVVVKIKSKLFGPGDFKGWTG